MKQAQVPKLRMPKSYLFMVHPSAGGKSEGGRSYNICRQGQGREEREGKDGRAFSSLNFEVWDRRLQAGARAKEQRHHICTGWSIRSAAIIC